MPVYNADIAEIFNKVADLLEIEGANPFRVRAYRLAAGTLRELSEPAADILNREGLEGLVDLVPGWLYRVGRIDILKDYLINGNAGLVLPAQFLQLEVGAGQTGAHILFDWNVTENIDVVLLWDEYGVFTIPDPAGAIYLGPAGPTPDAGCVY